MHKSTPIFILFFSFLCPLYLWIIFPFLIFTNLILESLEDIIQVEEEKKLIFVIGFPDLFLHSNLYSKLILGRIKYIKIFPLFVPMAILFPSCKKFMEIISSLT